MRSLCDIHWLLDLVRLICFWYLSLGLSSLLCGYCWRCLSGAFGLGLLLDLSRSLRLWLRLRDRLCSGLFLLLSRALGLLLSLELSSCWMCRWSCLHRLKLHGSCLGHWIWSHWSVSYGCNLWEYLLGQRHVHYCGVGLLAV